MRYVLFGTALVLSACATAPASTDGGITRACVRSFPPTLDAWEVALGEVPAECRALDDEYDVVLASEDEMPCDEAVGVNEVRTECVHDGVLYVNEALDDLQRLDASVHGWIHTLALCVDGDYDRDHLQHLLWAVYKNETAVEFQAHLYGVEPGECI